MTSDAQWLAGRLDADLTDPALTRDEIRAACTQATGLGLHGVIVDPTHVTAVPDGLITSVVVGYPTGRHHSLVKAAEARLAVQEGAQVVWLAVDATVTDANALLADVVAVRQAVPPPVRLAVITVGSVAARDAATAGGADFCVGKHPVDQHPPGQWLARAADLSEVVEALENGAARAAVADPGAVLAELT